MNKLNLIKYAKSKGLTNSLDLSKSLEEDLKIKCYIDTDQNGDSLYTFKYNQIESNKADPIVKECRGIILDHDMNVVFKGFSRFFNVGETVDNKNDFNWDSFSAFEKADGSLIKIYYHNGFWQIGTNGTAMANVEMGGFDGWSGNEPKIFRNEVIKCLGYDDEEDFQRNAHSSFFNNLWYVFEFTSPENRVVTPYTEDKMVLLSVFSGDDDYHSKLNKGDELHWQTVVEEFQDMQFNGLNVRLPDVINGMDQEKLIEKANSLEGLQEGYVLVDSNGNRLKLKSEKYVAAHRMRGDMGLTLKRACELVLMGEWEEYLAYFKDDSDKVMKVVGALDRYIDKVDLAYDAVKDVNDQKLFAIEVAGLDFKHLLFAMRRDDCNAKEAFYKMRDSAKVKTLMDLV